MRPALMIFVLFTAIILLPLVSKLVLKADSPEAEVRATEAARVEALTRGDISALAKFMAEDITYVHASGKTDTKSSYLDAIRSGQLRYLSFQPKKMNIRVVGDAAVLDGIYSVRVIDARVQKDPLEFDVFFLTVYGRRDGRWQQIAWQTTRVPPSPK